MGGVHLDVRTCERADVTLFPYLGNVWTDCAEMWHVVRDPLARLFMKVKGGEQLHVRTLFDILKTNFNEIWYVTTD